MLTSPGPAAIAVVRICGPRAEAFLTRYIRTRRPLTAAAAGDVRRAELLDVDGSVLDDIVISVHATPPAWDVRLHLHGNPQLVRRCTELAEMCDLRAAEALDTSLWAVQDALEVEAYALLPQMPTLRGAQWLLGQPARLRDLVTSLPKRAALADACAVCRHVAARTNVVSWFAQPCVSPSWVRLTPARARWRTRWRIAPPASSRRRRAQRATGSESKAKRAGFR